MTPSFRSTAVVGAGAVGSFYGAMLARTGHPVTLIARPAHVQAIEREGLRLQMAGRIERVRIAARTDIAAVRTATDELAAQSQKMGSAIYANAQANSAAAGQDGHEGGESSPADGAGGGAGDGAGDGADEVIDAEIVDEGTS